jgi:hypothetical protein
MPKEYVEGGLTRNLYADIVTSDQAVESRSAWRVEIGWDKHFPDVRIATTNPNAEIGSLESGLWVDLDRDSINELIRLLRKARDGAYGKDE